MGSWLSVVNEVASAPGTATSLFCLVQVTKMIPGANPVIGFTPNRILNLSRGSPGYVTGIQPHMIVQGRNLSIRFSSDKFPVNVIDGGRYETGPWTINWEEVIFHS